MKTKSVLGLASVIAAAAVAGATIVGTPANPSTEPDQGVAPQPQPQTSGADSTSTRVEAMWVAYPSLAEIVRKADVVIVAEVTGSAPGRTVTDFTGTDVTPFTNAQLRILGIGKGSLAIGQTIILEQFGGMYRPGHRIADSRLPQATVPPAAGVGVQPPPAIAVEDRPVLLELREDPLLRIGEKVVLPLVWNGGLNLYQRFAFQGRFALDGGGRVHPALADDPVVAQFDGLPLGELLNLVRSAATQLRASQRRP